MLRRTPGEKFKKNDIEYEFVKSIILPIDKDKFEDLEDLNNSVDAVTQAEKIEISDENKFGNPNKAKAAILIIFKEIETNKLIGVLKYRASVSKDTLWTQAEFTRETGFSRASSDGKTISTSQKESLKLKPGDLVGDDKRRCCNSYKFRI